MFLLNSRLGHFTATPSLPRREVSESQGHPFSRSYGVILPSSLARVLSRALVFSTYSPVSVCGTGSGKLTRGFSWPHRLRHFGFVSSASFGSSGLTDGFIYLPPYKPQRNTNSALAVPTASPHCVLIASHWRRNFDRLSIGYAFQPHLRPG